MLSKNFKFIDLFSGIGGIRIAFENTGGKCVFSSEIDSECAKTYEENFSETPAGDVTQISPKDIPNHDILCAGFPCQPFSISGHQKGFYDTRGTLFFNIMEIVKEKSPSIIFLENVKHLKNHDNGRTLKVILRSLEDAGYYPNWKVLNAKDFGLAQNRERIYIVATKKGYFDFAKLKHDSPNVYIKDILDKTGDFHYLEESEYTILPEDIWKKQKSGLMFVGYRNKPIRKSGVRPNTEHLSRVHKQPNRIYHIEGTHPTLPSQEPTGRFWIYNDKRVRKLTINECYKLMGFPENFKRVSSNGALYNQVGNSVAIPVVQNLAREIFNQFGVE